MSNPRKLVYKDGSPMREYTSKIIEELMSKQQTAVEWLEDCYHRQGRILPTQFEQAKQMEKEQIIKAVSASHDYCEDGKVRWMGEQYYNETYGKE